MVNRMSKKRDFFRLVKMNRTNYLMILPFMVVFMLFTVIPVVTAIILSFTDFDMLSVPKFTGWDNYIRLFLDDEVFLIAVKNTLIFSVLTGPLSYFLCLIFAWLVNMFKPKVRAFLTFVFYAPSISGNVYVIWNYIFSGDSYGLVNSFLMNLGFIKEPVQWFTNTKYMLPLCIMVSLWLSLGTSFLTFIAGFQGIDTSLYEAGALDGIKSRVQELIYITLPSMGPQLLFGAVMQISASFSAGAVCETLAGFPSTDYAAHTVVTHIKDYGTLRYEMGYACAIATILTLSMVFTNHIIRKILKKHTV